MDWKYLFTSFEGRINRGKFWAGVLVLFILSAIGAVIDNLTGFTIQGQMFGAIYILVSLASLYFAIALYTKRWHDRDKSGWWTLIVLVPIIGGLWLLIECGILAGTRGPNRYGPDPLA